MNNDDADAIRAGEELNEQNLSAYLRSQLSVSSSAMRVKQFRAGSSNLTYRIEFGADEFVLRRPPFGNTVETAHDMTREFRVLEKLSKVYRPAPKPILFCADESIIGAEFYLMERKRGVILRGEDVPPDLRRAPGLPRRICEAFVDNLAALHALDYEAAGLADLGKPQGYARRQVEGWTRRYFAAKTDDWLELESAVEWLGQNIPAQSAAALVHNDYKFDNIMLAPDDLTRIVGVLDWEMCTIGDPLMDLGTTLGYWMDAEAPAFLRAQPFNPPLLMETVSRRELADRYAGQSGRRLDDLLFYYVFGAFKIAAIAQQIYFRFAKGSTQDSRFADFNQFVRALGRIAADALERQKI